MNERIELTENDITVDQWLGIAAPNGLRVKIYVNNKTPIDTGVKLRKQILENQEKAEKWDKRDFDRTNLLTESNIKYMQKIKQLKDKLEKIETFSKDWNEWHDLDGLITIDILNDKLKEILGS